MNDELFGLEDNNEFMTWAVSIVCCVPLYRVLCWLKTLRSRKESTKSWWRWGIWARWEQWFDLFGAVLVTHAPHTTQREKILAARNKCKLQIICRKIAYEFLYLFHMNFACIFESYPQIHEICVHKCYFCALMWCCGVRMCTREFLHRWAGYAVDFLKGTFDKKQQKTLRICQGHSEVIPTSLGYPLCAFN